MNLPENPAQDDFPRLVAQAQQLAKRAGMGSVLVETPASANELAGRLMHMLDQQLREKERLTLALDSVHDGLWDWDSERGQNYLSPAWKEVLGFAASELGDDQAQWEAMMHPDDLPEARRRLISHLKGETGDFQAEYRLRTKEGTWCWIATHGRVVARNAEGRATRVVGVHRNINDRKGWEFALLRAKEAAESASRAKGDFLANMSHEIRTPMNGIIGMTELALDTQLDSEQRGYLTTVKSSAESLLSIINDILDFSKIEAGKLELENIEFSLPAVISDTFKALALRGHQKGLEMVFGIAPGTPHVLRGDPNRLRQVLMNLLGNAIKFTEKGEIEVVVRLVSREAAQARLQFEVRDTGIGIARDKQDEIFGAFSQADTSTTRRYGGTGLGLAICRELVELMHGRIWVASEAGQGSTFHFTTEVEVVREEVASERVDPRLTGMRALLVEDSRATAREIGDTLKRWGVQVSTAVSGEEALATLKIAHRGGEPFDLMIVDGNMPEPGGFDLPSRFHEEGATCERIIMMLTTDSQRNDSARCRQLGVRAHVVKPVSSTDLLDAIKLALIPAKDMDVDLEDIRIDEALAEADSPRRVRDVLLVEDNPVNQTVATKILERGGYRVTVAGDGQEAIECFEKQRFDLILMDVQMPVLGGLDATKAIRAREARRSWAMSGRWEVTPIIAMTAHVMQGDREKCLDAGMDDYVSKPIQPQELFAAIERVTRRFQATDFEGNIANWTEEAQQAAVVQGEVADLSQTMALLDGDRDALVNLIGIFLADYPKNVQQLESSAAKGDMKSLGAVAHSLKSSVGVFGASVAADAAQKVEHAARRGEAVTATLGVPVLLAELQRLSDFLATQMSA
ncbi:PAS domain-containing hybrid sensor histidine kinase/response regulator [Uliginosibacterium sp. H1]|uniref:PAS domain-containing hybrid sensor histidine kinase/response regulator n=1 Tax=Uliginosibacterium sp. H1 TaxID=3114757 RepID=UPI002E18085A|nr:response regulator [Uliginosibacterium sp. H1]